MGGYDEGGGEEEKVKVAPTRLQSTVNSSIINLVVCKNTLCTAVPLGRKWMVIIHCLVPY